MRLGECECSELRDETKPRAGEVVVVILILREGRRCGRRLGSPRCEIQRLGVGTGQSSLDKESVTLPSCMKAREVIVAAKRDDVCGDDLIVRPTYNDLVLG